MTGHALELASPLLGEGPWRSRSECSLWGCSVSSRSTSSCVASEESPMVVFASLAFVPLFAYLVYAIWWPERF
jgi:K+-transporting ATPase KdpF subunit